MIKIVIVDEDKGAVDKLKSKITKISMQFEIEIAFIVFSKYSEELQKEIEKDDAKKIYILEIDLHDSISGIDIANKIREDDWDSEIIFATSHASMFETVFRNIPDVFDFIEKFHNFDEKLEFDIEKIFKKNFDKKMLKYKTRNIDFRVYYKSILYIYRDTANRSIGVVTKQNTFYLNISLSEVMELLDKRFLTVHRACIINTEAVVMFNWQENTFQLETGEVVNLLSKKYKKDIAKICN